MIYNDVNFDKLIFENKEMNDFKKFIKIKGIYLHKQIYDALLSYNKDKVTYYELSSVIRYDKSLRDILYKYLATFEEKLRSELFERYDVESDNFQYKSLKGLGKLKKDIKFKKNKENSNLYYCFQLDLGTTISLIEFLKFYDKRVISDLRKIKNLRNNVMHHNILVLGNAVNKEQAEFHIETLKNQIKTLWKYLPYEYQEGFQKSITNLNLNGNGKHYLDKLCLENIKWDM